MNNLICHERYRFECLMLFVFTAVLVFGGTVFLMKDGASHWLVLPLAITMTLLGLCFWWIDRRNVAATKSFKLGQKESEEGAIQANKGDAKTSGSCRGLDGYACIYILGILLGLYFSVMPFFVQLQSPTSSTSVITNPKPANQPPAQIRPINQMPQAMTPIQRPNFAPMQVMPSAHPPAQIRPLTPPSKPQ